MDLLLFQLLLQINGIMTSCTTCAYVFAWHVHKQHNFLFGIGHSECRVRDMAVARAAWLHLYLPHYFPVRFFFLSNKESCNPKTDFSRPFDQLISGFGVLHLYCPQVKVAGEGTSNCLWCQQNKTPLQSYMRYVLMHRSHHDHYQ
jgi:hypothetical protein